MTWRNSRNAGCAPLVYYTGMQLRLRFRSMAPALISLLIAGCHSTTISPTVGEEGYTVPRTIASTTASEDLAEKDRVDAHAHYAAATIHELNGEGELALQEFFESACKDLDNEPLILEVSRRLLQAKRNDQALDLVSRATARRNASGILFARLGFIHAQMEKPDLAREADQNAIRKDPKSLAGYQNLFLLEIQGGRTNEALGVIDRAAKVSQPGPEFLIGLAELYGAYGSQVPKSKELSQLRGLSVLRQATNAAISDPHLELRLANAFTLLGQDAEAARVYEHLVDRLPDASLLRDELRAKLAQIYLQENDSERAAKQLAGMLQDNPTDIQAHYFLGQLADQDKKYDQAAEHFSKVVLLSPDAEPAYYQLADAQISAGKSEDAISTLEKARQKFSSNFLLEYLTGLAHSVAKDYTNSVKFLRAAETIGSIRTPERLTAGFYFQFGVSCERSGDYEEGVKKFEKCLALAPDMHEAQNYLGYMLADRGEQLDRARELIAKALAAEPASAAYLDSMGWVLYRLNQPEEALRYVEDAVKKSEEPDATLYDHLGDILAKLGRAAEARAAWEKSLSIEENVVVRKKVDAH